MGFVVEAKLHVAAHFDSVSIDLEHEGETIVRAVE